MTIQSKTAAALAALGCILLAAPAAAQDWTGPYLGLSLGAAGSEGTATRDDFFGAVVSADVRNGLFPESIEESDSGLTGGVSLGYDRQMGRFVGGIAFDLSALDVEATPDFARVDPEIFPGVITRTDYRTEIDALSTLRLRGGLATGETLVYATAGLAAGWVENGFALSLPNATAPLPEAYVSPDWHESGTRYGYTIGAGVERRLGARLSLTAEAMYFDLEDVTVEGRDPAVFVGQGIDYSFDNDGYAARIGVAFRF